MYGSYGCTRMPCGGHTGGCSFADCINNPTRYTAQSATPLVYSGVTPNMSLRDYFAGQVMAGLYVRATYSDTVAAAIAYEAADAMLKQRDK